MRSPSILQRGLFVSGVGSLLVSVLFSVNGFPAAELFSLIGSVLTIVFYVRFQKATEHTKRSDHARLATLLLLIAAIVLKSFGIAAGGFIFLLAFMAFLVWFVWSVLEQLPPTQD
jgi:Ca2+/Na+ antiporter